MYAAHTRATLLRHLVHDTKSRTCLLAVCGDLVLVTDATRLRIVALRIDDGAFVRYVVNADGRTGSADGQLKRACAMAVYGDSVLVADDANGRVSMFRVSDGAFVRHLNSGGRRSRDGIWYPQSIAVCGDLALVTDLEEDDVRVLRISDGSLVRHIGEGQTWRNVTVAMAATAACEDLALVASEPWWSKTFQWYCTIYCFRISDGMLVRQFNIDGCADHMAVTGDLVLVSGWESTRISAYRISDGTCAYSFDAGDADNCSPRNMAVHNNDNTLLVTDLRTGSVKVFRLPEAIRWQPDVDVHAQFCGAFRGVVVAALGVTVRAPLTGPSRLPLELVCAVIRELTSV